jgi:hypothetical protein
LNQRRLILLAVALAGTALLAFFLRSFIQDLVILPLAHFFWQAGLVYRAIPQIAIWVILLAVLISLTIGGFIASGSDRQPRRSTGYLRFGEDVQAYLSAALKTSFADYPRRGFFSAQPRTPFDRDIEPVIDYLESLMEDEHGHQHS